MHAILTFVRQCGPFFGPLMQDLKSRCGASSSASSATGGVTVSAVFDALGSQPMLEFHTRYFEGFIPNAIASSSSSLKFGKMSELLAAVRDTSGTRENAREPAEALLTVCSFSAPHRSCKCSYKIGL